MISLIDHSCDLDKYMSIPSPPHKRLPPPIDMPDSEALITVELLFVDANCPTNEDTKEHLQIANIQFNNLDIIGETYSRIKTFKLIFIFKIFNFIIFFI
jgi:hypothetical protein